MQTVLIALGSFVLYIIAYRTYGRYLARRIFQIDPERLAPSVELEDGVDFVPSRRAMVFGHHFTSIAGTGPIVGPAVDRAGAGDRGEVDDARVHQRDGDDTAEEQVASSAQIDAQPDGDRDL